MILDLIIIAIILISGIIGYRRGFVRSLFMLTGWLIAGVGAFFLSPQIRKIMEHTSLKSAMDSRFRRNLEEGLVSPTGMIKELPLFMQERFNSLTSGFIDVAIDNLVNLAYGVMCFLIAILMIRIAIAIIIAFFSKTRRGGGIIHSADGFFGLALGATIGVFLVFLLFAIYPMVMTLIRPEHFIAINNALNASYLAAIMYDNNLLLMLLFGGGKAGIL